MPKRNNPFAGFQEQRQESREKVITRFLKVLQASRAQYPHVTALAEMVAREISNAEGTACNRATLLRNKRYKSLLLHYMAMQLGEGVRTLRAKDVTDGRAKALLAAGELQASNLKREVERMRTYIATLEARLDSPKDGLRNDATTGEEDQTKKLLQEMHVRWALTCKALWRLLRHYESVVLADLDRGCIIDPSKTRGNIVVDAETAGPFFEWLRQNESTGGPNAK